MKWLIQRQQEARAHEVQGSFEQAVRFAKTHCRGAESCSIFSLPENVRVAEVNRSGLQWRAPNWFEHGQLLCREHPEWTRMWRSLYKLTGSYADANPVSGERWQYLFTFWKDRSAIGSLHPVRVLVHEFRHRDRSPDCDPIPGAHRSAGRIVLHLSASHEYSGNWNHPVPEGTLV